MTDGEENALKRAHKRWAAAAIPLSTRVRHLQPLTSREVHQWRWWCAPPYLRGGNDWQQPGQRCVHARQRQKGKGCYGVSTAASWRWRWRWRCVAVWVGPTGLDPAAPDRAAREHASRGAAWRAETRQRVHEPEGEPPGRRHRRAAVRWRWRWRWRCVAFWVGPTGLDPAAPDRAARALAPRCRCLEQQPPRAVMQREAAHWAACW